MWIILRGNPSCLLVMAPSAPTGFYYPEWFPTPINLFLIVSGSIFELKHRDIGTTFLCRLVGLCLQRQEYLPLTAIPSTCDCSLQTDQGLFHHLTLPDSSPHPAWGCQWALLSSPCTDALAVHSGQQGHHLCLYWGHPWLQAGLHLQSHTNLAILLFLAFPMCSISWKDSDKFSHNLSN